ncbi:low-density lipoprotein receptor-related protein 2-like isoform X2 [Symsagittifera roscoffensis]|uniref:low-density lipoprotein receptor-related protein 2-like isoform X2 n=1 Tax=Symsagittifera roscoffensis TaxID=84072 RepID=UPI00307BB13A
MAGHFSMNRLAFLFPLFPIYKQLPQILTIIVFLGIGTAVAETGSDVFYFLTGRSDSQSNLYTWTSTDGSSSASADAYVTLEGKAITTLTCSFWGSEDQKKQFFVTKNTMYLHWAIMAASPSDAMGKVLTDQGIGINGVTQITYDPHLDYLYFANHYSSHWTLEAMNVSSPQQRIELIQGSNGGPEVVALLTLKQTFLWLLSDNTLGYSNLDATNKQTGISLTSGKTVVDLTGYNEDIYIAYSDSVEKRSLQNDLWTAMGWSVSFDAATVKSIVATSSSLYVGLSSGKVELIDMATWTKADATFADFSSWGLTDFCVTTAASEDPTGFKSACTGISVCSEFCFDVEGAPTCYCAHEALKVEVDEDCPEPESHLVTSSGLDLVKITNKGSSKEAVSEMTLEGSDSQSFISDLSYHSPHKTIYVAIDNQIRTISSENGDEETRLELDYEIHRVRVDHKDSRVYIAGANGDIEFYDGKRSNDRIKESRHLVISRIHANDFVLDFCYKHIYIASQNPNKIVRASDMGGNFETILSGADVGMIDSLAIDRVARVLYYSDSVKRIIGKIDLTDTEASFDPVHELNSSMPINSMDIYEDYLYFFNPEVYAVQRIDLSVSGSLANVIQYQEIQRHFRLTSLADVQCPETSPCDIKNGGCMDECRVHNGKAVCQCSHSNQYLVGSIHGYCDWSNKTQYCEQGQGSGEHTHLSCEFAQKCILFRSVCDGVQDCVDGADEDANVCSMKTCEDDEFKCHNGRCIPTENVCDHDDSCRDNSDELYCEYKDIPCEDNEFRCAGNHRCIREEKTCNGADDCNDGLGSDELVGEPTNCGPADCSNQNAIYGWLGLEFVECTDTHICIVKTWRCDNHPGDCGTDSDEEGCDTYDCGEDNFKCDNGNCVYVDGWVCDNYNDCGDYSDESPNLCNITLVQCNDDEFKCNNGKCIPKAYRCDSDNDCEDNSDEEAPHVDCPNLECEPNQFKCSEVGNHRRRCIPLSWVCDREADCGQSDEDERDCEYPHEPCAANEFQCDNKLCIPNEYKCDHDNDCGDNSDEPSSECQYRVCQENEFTCRNGKCILGGLRCDYMNDCGDKSDEDEDDCDYEEDDASTQCDLETEFECVGNLRKKCISIDEVCDGTNDCDHGTDETNCDVNECEIEEGNSCEQVCVDLKSGYRCGQCNEGFQLEPNDDTHSRCLDIDECSLQPRYCTQRCRNLAPGVVCSCVDGYSLTSDTVCKHVQTTTGEDTYLLFTDEVSVRRLNLNTGSVEIVEDEGDLIVAADFNRELERVFFVDNTQGKIRRTHINGLELPVDFITRDVQGAEGLSVDWVGKNVYWTDNERATIEVATIDGKYRKTLVSEGIKSPRPIVVYPRGKLLFYADWGYGNKHIGRMYMDGTMTTRIVVERISWPNGLTVDETTEMLYWVDSHLQTIETCDFDGNKRYLVMSSVKNPGFLAHPFALSVFDQFVFWTDWVNGTINRADKRDGSGAEVISETAKRPMDVRVYHRLKQLNLVTNAEGDPMVSYEQSGCAIMLLTVNGGSDYICACPDDFRLNPSYPNCRPCSGNGEKDLSSLECRCFDGYKGINCERKDGRGGADVIGVVMLVLILVVISLVVIIGIIYRHEIKRTAVSLMNRPLNEPVSFHVGGRVNPGFNTHDNDRETLASDFAGVVEGPELCAGNGLSAPADSGRYNFSNPVFEINEAQLAIRDFKAPGKEPSVLYAPSTEEESGSELANVEN